MCKLSLPSLPRRLALLAATLGTALLVACGGGGTDASGQGTLRLAITDAPACGYQAVNVTVEKVRVHRSAGAADGDSGWVELAVSPARRLDLLTLQNGVLSELGQIPLEAGTYTQLRLVLAENSPANPLANAVLPVGQATERPLTTPSAQQSGLKTHINITVEPDRLADFVIDFQVCKSIVRAGNSGRFLLKPVLSVMPRFIAGVGGTVEPTLANGDTQLSLQLAGIPVRSTTPDATGRFLLQPVPAGSYTLVVSAPGRATAVVSGVVVTAGAVTNLAQASGLVLPSAGAGVAVLDGRVATGLALVDASVAVRQTLTGGTIIQLVDAPVDADSGDYAYSVPTVAPLVAPYVAAPAPLVFVADTGAAGRYFLRAVSGGAIKTSATIELDAGERVTTPFVFP